MKKLLVVLGAVVAIAVLIVALRTTNTPSPVTTANAAEVAPTVAQQPAPPPVAAPPPAVEAAIPSSSAAPSAPPDDAFAHRAEIEAAAARGDWTVLPALQKIDLTTNGYVAAAAIDAVGKLAALAPEKEKREAARTLDGWLKQESKRKAPEALGNVSICVDALQNTKSDAAIAPLVSALDSASLPLHIETRIVEALTALNATTSGASVERFVARVRSMQPRDDFEKELVSEALATADAALKKWTP